MRLLSETLDRLRESDLPVLIRGETGSGKEFVARILHAESRRSSGAFQVIDCATIPGGLFEAELFGAKTGAFTDLKKDRQGILEQASGGTVLLDEICAIPPDLQTKLLRVVAAGMIRPLGADREQHTDVRFLFSTARDLEREIREGRFRSDLLHRINVVTVAVPPLRQRLEDLPGLVQIFLKEVAATGEAGQIEPSEVPNIENGLIDRLCRWPWPGNVRELRNLVSRLVLEDPRILRVEAAEDLLAEPETTSVFPGSLLARESLPRLRERLDRDYMLYHIRRLGSDVVALCKFLQLSRRQLYRRCERLQISLRNERRKAKSERPRRR